MKHKHNHNHNQKHKRNRTINRLKKRYKQLAAAVAGAAILSGTALPAMPATVAHASPNPTPAKAPVTTLQPGDKSTAAPEIKTAMNTPTNYKQVLDITATAYAPGPHDNAQWGNLTFLGTQVRPGIIAVDPNVIPLGSRVYIQYPDGHGEYAIAEDTGGAIKGARIDVAKWTVQEAKNFGIQHVKVYVISSPQKA